VAREHPLERLADGRHLGRVDRSLLEGGREAGGQQEVVAVAQRYVELLGQMQHHLPARLRAARLQEAQVSRRDAGLEREVELAEAAPPAPVAQQRAEWDGGRAHGRTLASARTSSSYLTGNRHAAGELVR
jgi:hypothetical protein